MRTIVLCGLLSPCLAPLLGTSARHQPGSAELRLTVATLHAAALTTPRAKDDTTDSPYLLVSILGPGGDSATVHLPASGHFGIHQDEALGSRPLTDLSLQPGDSVRVLVSVLEGPQLESSAEAQAASSSTLAAFGLSTAARTTLLSSSLAPLRKQGAHWLGSVVLLLTNERGSTYWRSLECAARCNLVKAPTGTALVADDGAPVSGVVELIGDGGSYHLQLQAERTLDDLRSDVRTTTVHDHVRIARQP